MRITKINCPKNKKPAKINGFRNQIALHQFKIDIVLLIFKSLCQEAAKSYYWHIETFIYNHFQKNFDEKNIDLTLKVLKNSGGFEFSFYNNIAARHFDVALLSHFPVFFSR